jgi:hypothetical protein
MAPLTDNSKRTGVETIIVFCAVHNAKLFDPAQILLAHPLCFEIDNPAKRNGLAPAISAVSKSAMTDLSRWCISMKKSSIHCFAHRARCV